MRGQIQIFFALEFSEWSSAEKSIAYVPAFVKLIRLVVVPSIATPFEYPVPSHVIAVAVLTAPASCSTFV
jgi:hypothetical protein